MKKPLALLCLVALAFSVPMISCSGGQGTDGAQVLPKPPDPPPRPDPQPPAPRPGPTDTGDPPPVAPPAVR